MPHLREAPEGADGGGAPAGAVARLRVGGVVLPASSANGLVGRGLGSVSECVSV